MLGLGYGLATFGRPQEQAKSRPASDLSSGRSLSPGTSWRNQITQKLRVEFGGITGV